MQIVSEKERKIKMDKKEFALNQHEKWNGKIETTAKSSAEQKLRHRKIWQWPIHRELQNLA